MRLRNAGMTGRAAPPNKDSAAKNARIVEDHAGDKLKVLCHSFQTPLPFLFDLLNAISSSHASWRGQSTLGKVFCPRHF
jgi:hypothetical protein